MAKRKKSYGRINAPPPVLNAPTGLPKSVAVPTAKRKMSLTVGLVSLGAAAIASGVYYENRRAARAEECRAQAAQRGLPPDNCPTARSSSSSRSSGHSWSWSSGSSSSSTTSSSASHGGSSTSGGHATFGGFGHSGSAHAGGS